LSWSFDVVVIVLFRYLISFTPSLRHKSPSHEVKLTVLHKGCQSTSCESNPSCIPINIADELLNIILFHTY